MPMTRVEPGQGLRISITSSNKPIAPDSSSSRVVLKYFYANMGFLPPFGSTSKPRSPHCPTAPLPVTPRIQSTLLPPATKAHILRIPSVWPGQVWYAQLQSRAPDQLSPFQFGHSTTRMIIVTMTLLGHYAKTLHSAYPPTPLPSASLLHSLPSLPRLSHMCNVLPSGHGDKEPLSQVKSREHDRGTLHLSQQLIRDSGEEIPQSRWRVQRCS